LDASVSEYAVVLLYEGVRCLQEMCSQHSEKWDFWHSFWHDCTRNFWTMVFTYSVGEVR